MGLLFRWVWGGKAHDRKRTWNGGPEIMEWSEDYSSRQRKSGNALWRPYFQSRYVTGMRGTSPKCATAYIISRSKTSKRNPPTVVLVRVRASSMMVETPKSPVDIKLQYDKKYFNNLGFFLANFKFLGFKMTDLPTEILPSSARKMLLGLRSLSKLQQTQKGKIIIRNHFYHPVPEFTSNYRNAVIFSIYWCFTVNVLFRLM